MPSIIEQNAPYIRSLTIRHNAQSQRAFYGRCYQLENLTLAANIYRQDDGESQWAVLAAHGLPRLQKMGDRTVYASQLNQHETTGSDHDKFDSRFVFPYDLKLRNIRCLNIINAKGLDILTQLEWISRCPNLIAIHWRGRSAMPRSAVLPAYPSRLSQSHGTASGGFTKFAGCHQSRWCHKLSVHGTDIATRETNPGQDAKERLVQAQKDVYGQLAQITELRDLYIGNLHEELTVNVGLGTLRTLNKLKRFSCRNMFRGLTGPEVVKTVEWMLEHWPRLEKLEAGVEKGTDISRLTHLLKTPGVEFLWCDIDEEYDTD
ncbi:hypothetical protein BGX28_002160 [Mortierella sp. GBA30]|nr:hypothetical protein BGX28_002160 [Mortierella sp. GBA30]